METQFAITLLSGMKAEISPVEQIWATSETDTSLAYDFKATRLTGAPGGGKSFQDSEGESYSAPLRAVIVDAVRTRGYWPEKDGNKVPLCSSLGGIYGLINPSYTEDDLRAAAGAVRPHQALIDLEGGQNIAGVRYGCAECSMSQFGSAYQNGDSGGQACKLNVAMLLICEGWKFPVLLSVPTMSVKPFASYASSLKQRYGREFYAFHTEIGIEKKLNKKGNSYGEFTFKNAGAIEDVEEAQAVMTLQKSLHNWLWSREVAIQPDEDMVDTTGRVVDTDGVIQ